MAEGLWGVGVVAKGDWPGEADYFASEVIVGWRRKSSGQWSVVSGPWSGGSREGAKLAKFRSERFPPKIDRLRSGRCALREYSWHSCQGGFAAKNGGHFVAVLM